jgi:hypothetical protein
MTAHEVQLQLPQVRLIDADVGQLPEARVNAVNRAALRDDAFDDLARSFNAFTRFCRQFHVFSTRGDGGDLLNGQCLTADLKHRTIAD